MSLLAPEGRSDVGAVVIQALICGLLVKRAVFLDVRTHFHEIEDFKKGYYVKFLVEAGNDAVEEYDRVCNIKEDIIRHILVKE